MDPLEPDRHRVPVAFRRSGRVAHGGRRVPRPDQDVAVDDHVALVAGAARERDLLRIVRLRDVDDPEAEVMALAGQPAPERKIRVRRERVRGRVRERREPERMQVLRVRVGRDGRRGLCERRRRRNEAEQQRRCLAVGEPVGLSLAVGSDQRGCSYKRRESRLEECERCPRSLPHLPASGVSSLVYLCHGSLHGERTV